MNEQKLDQIFNELQIIKLEQQAMKASQQAMKESQQSFHQEQQAMKASQQTMAESQQSFRQEQQAMKASQQTMAESQQSFHQEQQTMKESQLVFQKEQKAIQEDVSSLKSQMNHRFDTLDTKMNQNREDIDDIKTSLTNMEHAVHEDVMTILKTIETNTRDKNADVAVLNHRLFQLESTVQKMENDEKST